MRKIYFLIGVLVLSAGIFSCAKMQVPDVPAVTEYPEETPASFSFIREDDVLNIQLLIPDSGWDYTSVLSDDGMKYTLVVRGTARKPGHIDIIRPVLSYETSEYPSGFRVIFSLASRHRLHTSANELGLHIKLTAIEPDLEILSMDTFGAWYDPDTPAGIFAGAEEKDGKTEIYFDNPPLYASGEAGGRWYVDIFGVRILGGQVKHKDLKAVNSTPEKTRLIFGRKQQICPQGKTLVIGRSCAGYSGIFDFVREKNDSTESFQFSVAGKPEYKEMVKPGMLAFGFQDTGLFGPVFARYPDGGVYKVETRGRDNMVWLVFLHEKGLNYRKYYSGDKFFVVFYRGES